MGFSCDVLALWVCFYLSDILSGQEKIKEIDRLVCGYEIPSDSIFFQGFRMMNYGGAFAWRWAAKRSQLFYIRDQFDKKFQWPFVIYYWLVYTSFFSMFLAVILHKFVLHIE